jgi:hypothetical protein
LGNQFRPNLSGLSGFSAKHQAGTSESRHSNDHPRLCSGGFCSPHRGRSCSQTIGRPARPQGAFLGQKINISPLSPQQHRGFLVFFLTSRLHLCYDSQSNYREKAVGNTLTSVFVAVPLLLCHTYRRRWQSGFRNVRL